MFICHGRSLWLPVCFHTCLSVSEAVSCPAGLSRSVFLFFLLSVYLDHICHSRCVCLSVCLSVFLSVCVCVCVSVCLSVCLIVFVRETGREFVCLPVLLPSGLSLQAISYIHGCCLCVCVSASVSVLSFRVCRGHRFCNKHFGTNLQHNCGRIVDD